MNREQMVRTMREALEACGPGRGGSGCGTCGMFRVGRTFGVGLHTIAGELVDAILPQVTTVEELEALPAGSKLMDDDGHIWWRRTTRRALSERPWLRTEADPYDHHVDDVLADSPLTVVWRP